MTESSEAKPRDQMLGTVTPGYRFVSSESVWPIDFGIRRTDKGKMVFIGGTLIGPADFQEISMLVGKAIDLERRSKSGG